MDIGTERAKNGTGILEAEIKGVKVLVKDYSSEDRETLLAVYDELAASPEGLATLRSRFDYRPPRAAFEAYLNNPRIKYRAVVTDPNNTVLGLGDYFIDRYDFQRAELSRLVVPDYQGKGVGTLLVRHLIKKCGELDPEVTRMESLTRAGNIAAISSLTRVASEYGGFQTDLPATDQVRFTFPLKK